MHLGNVFSCLMAWLGARSAGGRMVLRIEDLDPRAHDRARAHRLISDLVWLGLDWDEGPTYQSDRSDFYREALQALDARGLTYPCFCTRSQLHAASAPHASDGTYLYQGTCRNLSAEQVALRSKDRAPAIRIRVPDQQDPAGRITFDDLVYGRQCEVLACECGDFLVQRSDGIFAYQLAVVVDDALMGVNQVVRGRDLLGSSARQTYLWRLLGYQPPAFAHIPLLISPDGRRLSKRDKDLDLGALRAAGVRPQQIVGKLAYVIGLTDSCEALAPQDLLDTFSWSTIARHSSDIVVDSHFLSEFML